MKKIIKLAFYATVLLTAQIIFAANFTTDFTVPANYTNDSEIEVNSGLGRLKETSIWNGLQGYWKMDDVAGQIIDSSGNGNNLTNHNASYSSAGKLNNSLSFTEGDYLDGGGTMMNMGLDDMTISSWFKTTDAGGILVGKSFYSGEDERYVLYFSSGQIRIMFDGGAANKITGVPSGPYLDDQWHQAVAVFDRDGDVSLYVDGVLKSSIDISAYSAINFDKNNLFLIGRYNDVSGSGVHATYNGKFSGNIDETAIWNRVLTPAEITTLYNSGNGQELEQYGNGTYSITKTAGNSNTAISGFTSFTVTEGVNNGSLHYQLSEDGVTWKYWDGAAWANAGATDYNTEAVINTNIPTFSTASNKIYVKSFLTSNGNQKVEIDKIDIVYTDVPANPTIAPDLKTSSDLGISNSDNFTADTTPTFNIVCSKIGNEITLYSDQPVANTNIGTHTCLTSGTEEITANLLSAGTHHINYTEKNLAGESGHSSNLSISIDATAPLITLTGSNTINLDVGDIYIDQGATANDNIDGDITANITTINPVNTNVVGTYTITYNVDDLAGNAAVEITRTVNISAKKSFGKSGPVRSRKKICRDKKALNYEKNGFHKQALCKYKKEGKEEKKIEEGKEATSDKLKLCPYFTGYYKIGDRNDEISKIQMFLKEQGFFHYLRITKYYGPITNQAIKDFQSKYSDEILKPWNLTKPTGRWYQSTRHQANELLGCKKESLKLDNGKVL